MPDHSKEKRFLPLSGLLLACLVGCGSSTPNQRGRLSYDLFPGTYILTNGRVIVVVAPQVGRIVGYHRVNEPNLLWVDIVPTIETAAQAGLEWNNYGGDKVWLSPMGLWRDIQGRYWPPDTTTDGDPWTVIHADRRKLIMVSHISPAHGARMTRTITLPDDTTAVRIDHHLERIMNDPYPVHIWTVTQIHLPKYALLDLTKDRPYGKGILGEETKGLILSQNYDLGAAHFEWPGNKSSKVGTYGRWVAAVFGRTIFAQYASLDVSAEYYDQANCEVYVDPTQQYMELELLSPTKYLLAGETLDFTVTWRLFHSPSFANQYDLVKLIESYTPSYTSKCR